MTLDYNYIDELDKLLNGTYDVLQELDVELTLDDEEAPPSFYVLLFLYGVVILIGISGNLLILYAILSKGAMRTARNYFIVILALSDLMLCIITMPLTLWDVRSGLWPFDKDLQWLCQMAHSCQGIPIFMSSMAIVAIAADRYRCIMQPERPPFSANNALLLSALMSLLAVGLTLPKYATARIEEVVHVKNVSYIIVCRDTLAGADEITYTVVSSCAQFLVPFTVVIVIYLSIYLRLRNRPQSRHHETNQRRRRANQMIMAITLIFFVSWLPLNLFLFLMQIMPEFITPITHGGEDIIYAVLQLCGFCNACINPILYGYLNENFRKEYKNIYRQMPWYSTSTHHTTPAIHLHIVTTGANGSSPNGPREARIISSCNINNNNEEAAGTDATMEHRDLELGPRIGQAEAEVAIQEEGFMPCLLITAKCDLPLDTELAKESILAATRERRLSVHERRRPGSKRQPPEPVKKSTRPSLRRLPRRDMILPGLGDVSVEAAVISSDCSDQILQTINESEGEEDGGTKKVKKEEDASSVGADSGMSGSHGEYPDEEDNNTGGSGQQNAANVTPEENFHVIVLRHSSQIRAKRHWRFYEGRSAFRKPACAASFRGLPLSLNAGKTQIENGGTDWSPSGILSARRTFSRQFSFPELLLSRYKRPPQSTRATARHMSSAPHPVTLGFGTGMALGIGHYNGQGGIDWHASYDCHPVDMEGLEETAV